MTDRPIDPTGKSALFGPPVNGVIAPNSDPSAEQSPTGRAALFSTPPRRPGTVIVECSNCKVRSRVAFSDLAMRFATGSLWFPLRRHQHWIQCPACHGRHWCRVGWTE